MKKINLPDHPDHGKIVKFLGYVGYEHPMDRPRLVRVELEDGTVKDFHFKFLVDINTKTNRS